MVPRGPLRGVPAALPGWDAGYRGGRHDGGLRGLRRLVALELPWALRGPGRGLVMPPYAPHCIVQKLALKAGEQAVSY